MMAIKAYEFTTACEAGLTLNGMNEHGELSWKGHDSSFREWDRMKRLYEDGDLPI